jgi:hypothetical protein
MKSLMAVDSSCRSDQVVDEGENEINAIIVNEWEADTFHRMVIDLELQGYAVRRETYRVTPEMNPETGQIVHLHTIELYKVGPDEAENRSSSESSE